MDSGPLAAAAPDDGVGESRRWADCKVYTRRNRAKKNPPTEAEDPQPSSRETLAENPQSSLVKTLDENPQPSSRETLATTKTTKTKDDLQSSLQQPPAEPPSVHQLQVSLRSSSDNEPCSLILPCPEGKAVLDCKANALHENGSLENRKDEPSQQEVRKIRKKLLADLGQVRDLFRRLEARHSELFAERVDGDGGVPSQFSANHGNITMSRKRPPTLVEAVLVEPPPSHSQFNIPVLPSVSARNSIADSMLVDEIFSTPVAAGGGARSQLSVNHATTPVTMKRAPAIFDAVPTSPVLLPFRPRLSIVVPRGAGSRNNVSELSFQKEKRTPKANQYFHSSDFILGKDKIPPPTSLKKSKASKSKKNLAESDYKASPEKKIYSSAFKSCRALLEKLMKHRFGWVFNKPVDVEALGLYDYFSIIKHPMDFGTVKSRLADNFYETPEEFAADVRLTLRNAMTYNSVGQDVHVMAQQLSNIFEERWFVIETEFTDQLHQLYSVNRKRASLVRGTLERSDSTVHPVVVDLRKEDNQYHNFGRPVPLKKPKAKDLYKREMTLKEKQTLSRHLESLPAEKLDLVVEIIKKRNFALSQHDDEIEVDIDSVDTDTLWELDRFVSNYKKTLSKHKRKAELAMLARAEAKHLNQEMLSGGGPDPVVTSSVQQTEKDQKNAPAHLAIAGVNNGDDANGSSSSSESSSDSGSSDSDSDSESSSSYESDVPH
ncbi:transcription factor GTE4-like [Zingiber officinale]|uniref:Transcription factor GTE4 n=1 Tax=Zingiber officinale TaxID=94328 RepID=A0A8J5GGR8_ZINOF|nr:transcription factor GTE4-like [Zingiber officinale]KAG6506217.1 hypothetical protein ZIOFF_031535 [Zingiber officinale]